MSQDSPLLDHAPGIVPDIDPAFRPMVVGMRRYRDAVGKWPAREPLVIGLEREAGLVSRYEMQIAPPESPLWPDTVRLVERIIKFLLWSRGGWKVWIGGPKELADALKTIYSPTGARAFDHTFMGRIYEHPFEVIHTAPDHVPPEKNDSLPLGGHMKGCRIGFDLGASDYKVSAVIDGETVWAEEFPWNPKDEPDPAYHYGHITRGLKEAAGKLPRVDAIGGSSAGVIIHNRIRAASLFRAVPEDVFSSQVAGIFGQIAREWAVPVQVANDGDVTALAGALSLGQNAMLGIAMGSSLAAGYLDDKGLLTGWLNELAFVPVDLSLQSAADEWSGDIGCGVQYFSQQGVMRLARQAGVSLDESLSVPERLKQVQTLMKSGDANCAKIYEAIGISLGYTLALYAEFYSYRHVLILGRVTTGQGGDIMIDRAKDVLAREFPTLAGKINLLVPDEKSRRVGQAVAAASLPNLGSSPS
ncbi:hypothetical protein QQ056_06375 [Oscillatoria laete-virens NRMC-F 0139]|nr:hypothetical protein [Oscillatoria laete-virens]MDL5053170.1 hypothetical protein [Oscillatoria laete-virens NRMC-F 0139]